MNREDFIHLIYSIPNQSNAMSELIKQLSAYLRVPTGFIDYTTSYEIVDLERVALGVNAKVIEDYDNYYFAHDILVQRMVDKDLSRFYSCSDLINSKERKKLEIIQDYLTPQNLHWTLRSIFPVSNTGILANIDFITNDERGDFSDKEKLFLNGLIPHLNRSLSLTMALNESKRKQKESADLLSQLNSCYVTVSSKLKPLELNSGFEKMVSRLAPIIQVSDTHIWICDRSTTRHINRAVKNTIAKLSSHHLTIPVTYQENKKNRQGDLRISIEPMLSSVNSYGARMVFRLVQHKVSTNTLRSYFNLTESESLIVQYLHQGKRSADIAKVRNTKISTIRQQIKSCLSKTDSNSQVEMIAKVNRFIS